MTGRTRLIINALNNSKPIIEIASELSVTPKVIYQVAKTHNIPLPPKSPRVLKSPLLSEEEKKLKKKTADANRYTMKKIKDLLDPRTAMPQIPMTAAKLGPLSSLNAAWIAKQGNKRSSDKEREATQMRYGLKTSCKQ